MSPEVLYKQNIARYAAELKQLGRKLGFVSVVRFLSFAGACYAIYSGFNASTDLTVVASVICTFLFVISVRVAFRLQDKKRLAEKMLYVNQNELGVISGAPNQFENGARFFDPANYSGDLDIFGQGSLYGLLNRTTTKHGNETLATALQQPILDQQHLILQQEAVRQLAPQSESRQLITAYGLLNEEKEGTLHDIRSWLDEPNRLMKQQWLKVARFIIPAFNLWAFYHFLDTGNQGPLLIGLAVAWAITGTFSKYIFAQHKLITKKQSILDQYASILRMFTKVHPANSTMIAAVKADADKADKGIHQLARLSGLFDQRLNLVVFVVLNSFFMYDIQCMLALENWKEQYKNSFDNWIAVVGKIELLNSLAAFAFNNHAYTYPLVHDKMELILEAMAHPLISGHKAVPNSMVTGVDEKLIILTGSNMSGKTTFLRTLGVNLVLAQCGAPVNAAAFHFKPMMILSSIRVGDSLQENTSYFMAELKKLRSIIDILQTQQPALVLIDEILRGTNSDDKTYGSEQFIRQLIRYNCLTLFATHDLSLSVLSDELDGKVNNYCFESTIENGELIFDYTLRQGVASNKNASFLMQKMGIIAMQA